MTDLRLIREPTLEGVTLGSLYLNGVWFCWVLEDAIREVPGVPVAQWKVRGQTAIPAGHYAFILSPSARFGRVLPELLKVPGFSAVRIHRGNTIEDTDGCLLVGTGRTARSVTGSRVAEVKLMQALTPDGGWITVENPTGG
jgi:hypothetical protein